MLKHPYAKFKFGRIRITQLAEGDSIKVIVLVTNQSDILGAEVVQLYIK